MKIFVLNGSKIAYNVFAFICILLIIYIGFIPKVIKIIPTSNFIKPSYICIIIDDFGNNANGTKEFLYLDIDYTGAVMPNMPYTNKESRLLFENNKDVILHMPMEAYKGKKNWLGKGALFNDMTIDEIDKSIKDSFSQINYAIGINNHMGSKIMENEKIVRKILEFCKENNLIFIDSKTTQKSVAKKIADELDVKFFERDIFLDSTKDISKIEKNLKQAIKIAKNKGFCIAIGHVGEEGGQKTVQAIKNVRQNLDKQNIKFITLSELVEILKYDT